MHQNEIVFLITFSGDHILGEQHKKEHLFEATTY